MTAKTSYATSQEVLLDHLPRRHKADDEEVGEKLDELVDLIVKYSTRDSVDAGRVRYRLGQAVVSELLPNEPTTRGGFGS